MKTLLCTLALLLGIVSCSSDQKTDSGSGYTHSDERLEPAQTGIQEQQMGQGDPQIQQQTN